MDVHKWATERLEEGRAVVIIPGTVDGHPAVWRTSMPLHGDMRRAAYNRHPQIRVAAIVGLVIGSIEAAQKRGLVPN